MYLDVVIENLQHNLTLNNLSSRPESKSRSGLCNCHACKSVEVRRTSVKANARKLDWMQDLDSLQAQFQKNPPDVIIACDCVYDPNTLGPLARVFLAALTAALPRRAVAYSMQEKRNPETHNQFLDALVIAGLRVKSLISAGQSETFPSYIQHFCSRPARLLTLYEITLPNSDASSK